MALCNCVKNRKVEQIGSWDHCPLEGRAHTNFVVLRCVDCGGVVGFPDFNFKLALKDGTPETKAKLKEIVER